MHFLICLLKSLCNFASLCNSFRVLVDKSLLYLSLPEAKSIWVKSRLGAVSEDWLSDSEMPYAYNISPTLIQGASLSNFDTSKKFEDLSLIFPETWLN